MGRRVESRPLGFDWSKRRFDPLGDFKGWGKKMTNQSRRLRQRLLYVPVLAGDAAN